MDTGIPQCKFCKHGYCYEPSVVDERVHALFELSNSMFNVMNKTGVRYHAFKEVPMLFACSEEHLRSCKLWGDGSTDKHSDVME